MKKEQLIEKICEEYRSKNVNLKDTLEKHLPDFNPNRIDEERYRRIYDRVGHMEVAIKEYNSNLPEPLQPLPSVEELKQSLFDNTGLTLEMCEDIAKHLHSKYGTQPRKWWMDLKPGDKFIFGKDRTIIFNKVKTYLFSDRDEDDPFNFNVQDCTPYTITADEIIKKHNLTEEEVRMIREGKC